MKLPYHYGKFSFKFATTDKYPANKAGTDGEVGYTSYGCRMS